MNKVIKPGSQASVIQAWKITYRDPLILHVGETLQVGKRDSEWSGWIWCTDAAGKGGWVPESYLGDSMKMNRLLRQSRITTLLS